MKKIIVSGATSMIGVALIEVCLKHDIEIHAIVRPNSKRIDRVIKHPNLYYHFSSLDSILEIIDIPNDCDVFYHFAWAGTDRDHRDDPVVQSKNIIYSLNAVKLAKKCGCNKFIGAGSQAEYGFCETTINENTLFNPVSSYGATKHASYVLCKKLCNELNISFVWGRIFSVYGPHDSLETMIMYAINCFKNRVMAKFSEGNQLWNYLYESDAGEIFFRLGTKKLSFDSYLIASEESIPLKMYIELLIKNYPDDILATFGNENTSMTSSNKDNLNKSLKTSGNNKVYSLRVNPIRTFKEINYYPKVSFEKGIVYTINSVFN